MKNNTIVYDPKGSKKSKKPYIKEDTNSDKELDKGSASALLGKGGYECDYEYTDIEYDEENNIAGFFQNGTWYDAGNILYLSFTTNSVDAMGYTSGPLFQVTSSTEYKVSSEDMVYDDMGRLVQETDWVFSGHETGMVERQTEYIYDSICDPVTGDTINNNLGQLLGTTVSETTFTTEIDWMGYQTN